MKEIISLTKALMEFKSVHSKPDEIRRCAQFIQDYLNESEVRHEFLDHENVPSIMVLPSQTSPVPIMLMSHLDVVEGPDELFIPSETDGRLYGRGSIDDKYAVALSLVLIREHVRRLRSKNKSQGSLPFGILITSDEEIGGFNGAKKALEKIKAHFCIVLDGGSTKEIVVKEKGVLRLKLICRGKTAHAARPWLGENAIENMISDYTKLKAFFSGSAPHHWHRTMNFSLIKAGKSANQVPDYAEALFDIRYTENDDVDRLIAEMQLQIRGEVEVEMRAPVFSGGGSPYLDILLDISEDTKLGFEHGASDARFLSEYGIKGIVWGADGDQSQHSLEEHVNIESVYTLYRVLDEFLKRVEASRNKS